MIGQFNCGGVIFFNGDYIGEVTEATITEPTVDESVSTDIDILRLGEPEEITFDCKVDTKALLTVLTGVHVTNNWLKMHGGVMSRKRHLKKRRV